MSIRDEMNVMTENPRPGEAPKPYTWDEAAEAITSDRDFLYKYGNNVLENKMKFNTNESIIDIRDDNGLPITSRDIASRVCRSLAWLFDETQPYPVNLFITLSLRATRHYETGICTDNIMVDTEVDFSDCLCPSHALKMIYTAVRYRVSSAVDKEKISIGNEDKIGHLVATSIVGFFMASQLFVDDGQINHQLQFGNAFLRDELPALADYNNFAIGIEGMHFINVRNCHKYATANDFIVPVENGHIVTQQELRKILEEQRSAMGDEDEDE